MIRPDRAARPAGHSRGVLVRCRGKDMPSAATTVDPVATTRFSGRAFSARELTLVRDVVRNCSGPEPDGAGADGVRAVAVAAPERRSEGARVPGVPRAARRRGRGCAAGQAARSRRRVGDAGSADGGRGAGSSAVGERSRRRAAGCRVGVRARPAPAVPGVVGSLPLSRSHGSVRGPLALSGVCVASRAGGGRVPAVFESGVAHGGPGPLGRLGRVGSGAESAAGGQQQPLPVAAVGEGEEPGERGAVARGAAPTRRRCRSIRPRPRVRPRRAGRHPRGRWSC